MSSFFNWLTSPALRKPAELELPAKPEIPSATPVEGEAEVPFVDRGMELPDSYGVDIVRALVQDPFHLMVYWEVRDDSLSALEGLFPDGVKAGFRPTMRLTDLTEGSEAYVHVPRQGKYWFVVIPQHQYRVDVGALSSEHGFVPVVRSNVVETPRGTVSTAVSEDPRYRVETHDFVKLLEVTGFANDRVLSDIARADAGRDEAVSPRLAPPSFLVEAFAKLPATVKEAAVTIAEGGTLTPDAVDTLPGEIRSILRGFGAGDEELLTAAFMHLLPQWLRDMLEGRGPGDGPWRLQLPARFSIGGSEQLQRPHVDWSWMPSMTETVTRRRAPRLEPDALDSDPNE